MDKIKYSNQYFNISDTLECGQTFRYQKNGNGYLIFSLDKCAYAYQTEEETIIECEKEDKEYFENYFDLGLNYSVVVDSAINSGAKTLKKSAEMGKGIRILRQNPLEMLYSFMISQNNNIPRIKKSLFMLCEKFGQRKQFGEIEYFAFPTKEKLISLTEEDFRSIGVGFRARYLKKLGEELSGGFDIGALNGCETQILRDKLTSLLGVGRKVADCVILFGFYRLDCFPVDTWIEKVYKQDFNGSLTDREEMSKWFVEKFKDKSGYYQQYLFDYKRRTENKGK